MKKILTIIFILCAVQSFAQYPQKQTIGSDSSAVQPKGALQGRIINWVYPDTASANLERISQYPGAQISVGDNIYHRNSTATKWILDGSLGSAISNGLLSTGAITLVDSTLTINDTIKWSYNGVTYTKTTPSVFTIHTADSGYYRKDLIYADATGLYKIVGVPNMDFGIKPKLPVNTIEITTVDIYGQQIVPPTPTIITPIPNLQQVTNEGNTTTNPIVINNNSSQTSVRINGNFNRSYYYYGKNANSGHWANVGAIFKNDVADNPNNEHSGHFLQLLMGSTNSDFMKDGGMIRVKGTGGLRLTSDSGRITFGNGAPFQTYPWVEFGAFETDGSFRLSKYKNNSTKDSVLTTDENGRLTLKKISNKDSSNYSTTTQINDTVVSVNKLNGGKTVWKFEGDVGAGSTGLPTIESGVYVPVISTPGTNSGQPGSDGGTSNFKYTRINNIVTVSGYLTVVPTGSGTISFSVSLPIASNFTNSSDVTGSVGGGWTSMTGGLVKADYTNDVILIVVGDTGTGGGRTYTFICQYVIK